MNKKIIIFILFIGISFLAFLTFKKDSVDYLQTQNIEKQNNTDYTVKNYEDIEQSNETIGSQTTTSVNNQETQNSTTFREFTLEQVMANNNEQSCYSVIDGNVYDLTDWIKKHPGGAKNILRICGKDGSKEFGFKHGGERGPEDLLASFKIGVLK